MTPGGACVEHGGARGSTRLAARVARAPPSAACAPRATARPDSPHFQNTPPASARATSALVAEAREVGGLSFSRARDAATRVAVPRRAPARVRLSRSPRRCVRERRDTRGTPALLMCPSVPALRAWLSPRCVRNAAWAAAHRGIRPSGACAPSHLPAAGGRTARGQESRDHHRGRAVMSTCASGRERRPDSSDRARLGANPPRLSRPATQVHRHAPGGEGERDGGHCSCHGYRLEASLITMTMAVLFGGHDDRAFRPRHI